MGSGTRFWNTVRDAEHLCATARGLIADTQRFLRQSKSRNRQGLPGARAVSDGVPFDPAPLPDAPRWGRKKVRR